MKKSTLFSILIGLSSLGFIGSPKAHGQYAFDVGVIAGFSNYLGEIGGGAGPARDWIYDLQLDQTRWNPGVFARYRLGYNIAATASLNVARLQGADSLTENPNRFTRNLHFRNDIIEFALTGEYYFFNQPDVGRTGRYLLDFKAYIYAGAAIFYNNPKAQYDGQWVALQPLNTEAREEPYSKFQPAIPIGFGMFYTFARAHRFGAQIGWRYTFTDYIDDISGVYPDEADLGSAEAIALSNRSNDVANNPLSAGLAKHHKPGAIRGNPESKDSYLLMSFSYSYVFRGNGSSFGRRKNYLYGRRRSGGGRARF